MKAMTGFDPLPTMRESAYRHPLVIRGGGMDIHKPKPWHGWREFLKEYLIVVVGVLTALGAEQLVEEIDWSHRVRGAEEAMRAELRQDERDAYFLLSTAPCNAAKLDEIQHDLTASREYGALIPTVTPYRMVLRPWSSDAWDSAKSMQIISHISNERLQLYSFDYVFTAALRQGMEREMAAQNALNTIAINAGRLQPAERDRLFQALVATRGAMRDMDNSAMYLLSASKPLGLQLSPKEQAAELRDARSQRGDCATAPALVDVAADRHPIS